MSKILVIDDEAGIRDVCSNFFSAKGYTVITAAEGSEALRMLSAEPSTPDIVLLDFKLPREDGLRILKSIRLAAPQIPVVIYSGYITPEIETRAFEAGAAEVLSKVMGLETVHLKIKNILAASRKNSTSGSSRKPPASDSRGKILVVDDEEGIRKLLAAFLKSKGFQVLEAKNGEEAVRIAKESIPSIIFLDVKMPKMDGITALEKIREFDSKVCVVMATSVQDHEVAQKAMELGCYNYILKPFDLKYLELVVLTRIATAY